MEADVSWALFSTLSCLPLRRRTTIHRGSYRMPAAVQGESVVTVHK